MKSFLSYRNRKHLQCLPVVLVGVLAQQLPFLLVLVIQTLYDTLKISARPFRLLSFK